MTPQIVVFIRDVMYLEIFPFLPPKVSEDFVFIGEGTEGTRRDVRIFTYQDPNNPFWFPTDSYKATCSI